MTAKYEISYNHMILIERLYWVGPRPYVNTELESGRWAKHGRGCCTRYLLRSTGAPIIVGNEYKAIGRDRYTVQITFIFIGQTHLVFGKRVCTCVMKHSNAFRTFLNWLKNSKRVWHERKLHIMRVPLFANFDQ